MNLRVSVDTNILAYAEGVDSPELQVLARDILGSLSREFTFVPLQVLGELFSVLLRKGHRSRSTALADVMRWHRTFRVIETTNAIFLSAVSLVEQPQLHPWDAIILSAAAEAGCSLILSEDMQDGFVWRGVTVANPFKIPRHPLLASVLESR